MAEARIARFDDIAADMRCRIREGVWRPDQMVPGRRALAAEYGVAVATLDRAVAMLIAEGHLRSDNRRGTFVSAGALDNAAGGTVAPLAWDVDAARATVVIVASIPGGVTGDAAQWPLLILRAAEDRFGALRGVTTQFVNRVRPDGSDASADETVAQILERAPDAVLLIGSQSIRAAMDERVSIPIVDIVFDPLPGAVCQVTIDEPYGGLKAAGHLLRNGYAPILYFSPFTVDWVEGRLSGVRAALANGVSGGPLVWPEYPALLPAGSLADRQDALAHAAVAELFAQGFDRGAGVVASNDIVAAAFMRVAAEHGFQAGVDYGLIGFDDYLWDADLSTMRPPLEQMGAEGARMVASLLAGEGSVSRVMLHHRLIARGSTRQRRVPERERSGAPCAVVANVAECV